MKRPRMPGILILVEAALAPASIYLAMTAAIAAASRQPGSRRRRGTDASRVGTEIGEAPITRFAVLVPAHNEESTIAVPLSSLSAQRYPSGLFDVHVVADNCTDQTAAIVRQAGHTVHERDDVGNPGKGPALNWLFQQLVAEAVPFDVAVFIDADTFVDPVFLHVFDQRFRDGGTVAAQGFYGVRDAFASTPATLRYCALAARHHLRPLARTAVGGSCGLFGNGMAFRRDLLMTRTWTDHLVEDMQFQLDLVLSGVRVAYEPRAQVEAEMPHTFDRSVTQHQRWERGRLSLVGAYLPRLARHVARSRHTRVAALDAMVDMCVPPLSILGAAAGLATGAGMASSVRAGRLRASAVIGLAMSAAIVGHVLMALRLVGAPRAAYRSLIHAPRLAAWKVLVLARPTRRGQWIRTARNAEESRQ